jgi:O-antigen/teichoic acid export membrane protein
MSLLRTGVHALKWSVLGELGARVLGPLTFIVLARILVPADFGVVAAATVLISLAQVLCELGLAKALVQRPGDIADAADTAFWLNAGFGALLMLALLPLAPLVAAFFGEPRVGPALQLLSPVMLLSALSAVPMALLQRALQFKLLFWVRLVGSGLPALAALPIALAGGGHWALVGGTLLGQAAQAAVLWWAGGWRPRRAFSPELAAELLRFGRWALLAGHGWLDAVVVGRWLGAHEMGLYRTGSTLVTLAFGLLFSPLLPVLYSLFSRAQHDLPFLRDSLLTVVRAASLVALPLALALYAARGWLAPALLGERWHEAGPVIGVLALAQGASWLVAFNGELYRAVGRPAGEVLVMGPLLLVYALVYVATVTQGLETFLWARFALSLFSVMVHVLAAAWLVGIAPRWWLRPLAGLVLGLAWVAATQAASPALVAALGPVPAGVLPVLLFAGLLLWSERRLIARLHQRWRNAPPAAAPAAMEI